MNTVGKKGKLGEDVRCVVSVSMLTEGWDANTVTHILGIRAFNSQLLCEQVVGRGLRRRDYSVNEEGRFEPEYAEVYGVPFAFIPTDRVPKEVTPKRPAIEVRALPERAHLRITFPKLAGYRRELKPTPLFGTWENSKLHVDKTTFATLTQVEGMVGESDEHSIASETLRKQRVAFELAAQVLKTGHLGLEGEPMHTRFPQLVDLAKEWLERVRHLRARLWPVDAGDVRRVASPCRRAVDRWHSQPGRRPGRSARPAPRPVRRGRYHRSGVVLHPQGRDRHREVAGQPGHARRRQGQHLEERRSPGCSSSTTR